MSSYKHTVFINRANSPLGFEITRKLARSGFRVFASDSSLYDIGHMNVLNPEVSHNIFPMIHDCTRDYPLLTEKTILSNGVEKLDYIVNLDTTSNKELISISQLENLIDSRTLIMVGANEKSSKELNLSGLKTKLTARVEIVKTPDEINFFNINSVVHKFSDAINRAPYKVESVMSFKDFLYYIAYHFVPALPLAAFNSMHHYIHTSTNHYIHTSTDGKVMHC